MEQQDHITLIHKSLTGQISALENQQLQEWINASPGNRNEYTEIKLLWELPIEEDSIPTPQQTQNSRTKLLRNVARSISNERQHKVLIGLIALVLLAVVIQSLLLIKRQPVTEEPITNIFAQLGNSTVLLNDSSLVNVNDSTTLVNTFSSSQRKVNLTGEARFTIRKEARPFIISTAEKNTITVKGTTFYVKAYPNKPLEVFVVDGNVVVANSTRQWQLSSGQYLSLAKGDSSSITLLSDVNFNAWLTEKLQFDHTPLPQVFALLERYYDIQCELPSKFDHCQFTGTFENESLSEVLHIISYGLKLTITKTSKDAYQIDGPGCTP